MINEVNFVLDGKKPIPIEIKYREEPKDARGFLEFAKKFDIEKGIVVTKD